MFDKSDKKLTNNEEDEIINVTIKSYYIYLKNSKQIFTAFIIIL